MPSPYLPSGLQFNYEEEEIFYEVIERLKAQGALPAHSFARQIPFFNVPSMPRETQIRELFENCCDIELCKQLLQNIVPLPENGEYELIPQNYSSLSVMSFGQIVLYKVLPCRRAHCSKCPREIATHNQYKDFEYECPFYHHERDRRRLVITSQSQGEFVYKANYFEEGRAPLEKDKYSQNYFESMFHPLYYKMFRCKRDFCKNGAFCPFYHCEQEKNSWDQTFKSLIFKDRITFLKDKAKAFDRSYDKPYKGRQERYSEQNYPYQEKNMQFKPRGMDPKPQYPNHSYLNLQYLNPVFKEDQMETQQQFLYEKRVENLKFEVTVERKDSDSSFEEKYGYGFFNKLQEKDKFQIY